MKGAITQQPIHLPAATRARKTPFENFPSLLPCVSGGTSALPEQAHSPISWFDLFEDLLSGPLGVKTYKSCISAA